MLLYYSNATHKMPIKTIEAGESEGLSADGGRVYQEPGASEAPGGETRGMLAGAIVSLSHRLTHVFAGGEVKGR